MRHRLLLLAAVTLGVAALTLPTAQATPPQAVTITIDETFYAPPTTPAVTGDITATGGIFGTQTDGTLASVSFKPVGFPGRGEQFPFQDHLFVYTATDRYTFSGGTFLVNFEASCNLDLTFVAHCTGNWQVNRGTGAYGNLKGTGTFTETQILDETQAGTGFITLTGVMHIDPAA